MGRTFSPAVNTAPAVVEVVEPNDSRDELCPDYIRWSYENAWDPDSDAFFKDAVYEAFVPPIPLEPITPVDSSDGSSASSSGRGTPADLPPIPGQISAADQDFLRWLESASPSHGEAVSDGPPPLPTLRRHSSSDARRGATQSHVMSSAAFERLYTRRLSRARVEQHLPWFAPDSDSDADTPAAPHLGVSVRTSQITPIQLPSSHPRTPAPPAPPSSFFPRPVTPPSSMAIPTATPNGDVLQPSPPPSVSPRVYSWIPTRPPPESPTISSRLRMSPRWPVY
ncbi:hypothetical protein BC834DRAFT_966552 [Gloeopeniophorella convolvens]|nr:hypothetical protein BC834DRAFT_966552 [Gloeopeniophorella convolvens]